MTALVVGAPFGLIGFVIVDPREAGLPAAVVGGAVFWFSLFLVSGLIASVYRAQRHHPRRDRLGSLIHEYHREAA